MTAGTPGQDPGWGKPRDVLFGAFVPWLAVKRAQTNPSVLVTLRTVFLSFCGAMAAITVVVLLMAASVEDGDLSAAIAVPAVMVIGFGIQAMSTVIGGRLKCAPAEALVAQYRTRFFLRMAFAESPALIGFVAFFLTGSILPFFAGLLPAVVGFTRAAPTSAALARDEDELRNVSCPHSLLAALLS